MLKWCSYCQQFMREIPDYDDFAITHGLCASCSAKGYPFSAKGGLGHALFLRDIFRELFDAGRHSDFGKGARIVEKAVAAGCMPVDVLMGMIAPMLYRIGEEWKRGTLSVAGEHSFTAFCEKAVELVACMGPDGGAAAARPGKARVLLIDAPGNEHTLASRMLALWLQSRGVSARRTDARRGTGLLEAELAAARPAFLLISMALPEQFDSVAAIAAHVHALPAAEQPRIFVGGYAVKAGLVTAMPGVELAADITALDFAQPN